MQRVGKSIKEKGCSKATKQPYSGSNFYKYLRLNSSFVVFERAFSDYFFVGRVHFTYHHIHQHSSQNIGNYHESDVSAPISIIFIKVCFTDTCLNQASHTGIKAITSCILLKQNRKEVTSYKQNQQHKERGRAHLTSLSQ